MKLGLVFVAMTCVACHSQARAQAQPQPVEKSVAQTEDLEQSAVDVIHALDTSSHGVTVTIDSSCKRVPIEKPDDGTVFVGCRVEGLSSKIVVVIMLTKDWETISP